MHFSVLMIWLFFKVISSTSAAIINLMVQIIVCVWVCVRVGVYVCVCVYTRVIVKFTLIPTHVY